MLNQTSYISVIKGVTVMLTCLLSGLLLAKSVPAAASDSYGPIAEPPTEQIRPGQFVWADLLTHDVKKAADFYKDVFGWDIRYNNDKSYAHASFEGEPVAAIAAYDEGDTANAESVWLLSISVRDVAAAAIAVKAAGGKVLEGPEELPGRGQYILVEDPRGALVMLLRATGGDPEENEGEHDWLWTELWTDDTAVSTRFYEQVIGYRTVQVKGTAGNTYRVMGRDQKPRATVIKTPFDDVSPNWLPYVKVADVDAVAMSVIQHGGKVLVPPQRDGLDYHVAIVADPTGGVFAIQEKEEQQ